MDSYKIGLLIPCTSHKRNWQTIKESYLYQISLKTFLFTQDKEHNYIFYIGIDRGDSVFDNQENQNEILKFKKVFSNVDFKFIYMDHVKKGHLTKMWNIMYQQAYDEGCDYFFQCGDDIHFATKKWVNDCIQCLKKHNDIGLTGPINNNGRILTQAFVSRKHMDIFGWFFPEEIFNWCCDDWYNWVYQPNHFFPLKNHYCSNQGGEPRYVIDDKEDFMNHPHENVSGLRQKTMALAQKHKQLILIHLNDSINH